MKKLITYLMLSTMLFVGTVGSIYANDAADNANGASGIILESDDDYNTPERIQERKQKMEQLAEFNNSKQARIDKYTISLPLIGQQNTYYCAPASGEMEIDYQSGPDNIYTQAKIASAMGTTSSETTGAGAARGLKSITGLNYTYQSLSEVSLYTALKTDINANVGVLLALDAGELYSRLSGMHMVAAKGYSSNSVIYLDLWKYNSSIFGQHEVSLSTMQNAIKACENKIVW